MTRIMLMQMTKAGTEWNGWMMELTWVKLSWAEQFGEHCILGREFARFLFPVLDVICLLGGFLGPHQFAVFARTSQMQMNCTFFLGTAYRLNFISFWRRRWRCRWLQKLNNTKICLSKRQPRKLVGGGGAALLLLWQSLCGANGFPASAIAAVVCFDCWFQSVCGGCRAPFGSAKKKPTNAIGIAHFTRLHLTKNNFDFHY